MIFKYNTTFMDSSIDKNLKRLLNQVYKLLPMREEGFDWIKPLETIIEEFAGMNLLILEEEKQTLLFELLCKLEGLKFLVQQEDFSLFRRIIFECLSLIGELQKLCRD